MKRLILLTTSFLIGCQTNPPLPNNVVEIPVSVPCKIRPVDKPIMPLDNIIKEESIFSKVVAALAEVERRKAYEKELEAAIEECQ